MTRPEQLPALSYRLGLRHGRDEGAAERERLANAGRELADLNDEAIAMGRAALAERNAMAAQLERLQLKEQRVTNLCEMARAAIDERDALRAAAARLAEERPNECYACDGTGRLFAEAKGPDEQPIPFAVTPAGEKALNEPSQPDVTSSPRTSPCPAVEPGTGHACAGAPNYCARGIHACDSRNWACEQWYTPPHRQATHGLDGVPLVCVGVGTEGASVSTPGDLRIFDDQQQAEEYAKGLGRPYVVHDRRDPAGPCGHRTQSFMGGTACWSCSKPAGHPGRHHAVDSQTGSRLFWDDTLRFYDGEEERDGLAEPVEAELVSARAQCPPAERRGVDEDKVYQAARVLVDDGWNQSDIRRWLVDFPAGSTGNGSLASLVAALAHALASPPASVPLSGLTAALGLAEGATAGECLAAIKHLDEEMREWRWVPEYAGYFGSPGVARKALIDREAAAEDHHHEHHRREDDLRAQLSAARKATLAEVERVVLGQLRPIEERKRAIGLGSRGIREFEHLTEAQTALNDLREALAALPEWPAATGEQPAAPPNPPAPPRCSKPGHTGLTCSSCAADRVEEAREVLREVRRTLGAPEGSLITVHAKECADELEQLRARVVAAEAEAERWMRGSEAVLGAQQDSAERLREAMGLPADAPWEEIIETAAGLQAVLDDEEAAHRESLRRLKRHGDLPPPDPAELRMLLALLDQERAPLARQTHHSPIDREVQARRLELIQRSRARLQALLELPAQPAEVTR